MKAGSQTPWGKAQSVEEVVDGVYWISTARHGGLKLSREYNTRIPEYMRNKGGFYEEDCEVSKVLVSLPELFPKDRVDAALKSLRAWFPDEYERFTCIPIAEGESLIRDQRIFDERHKNDFVVTSAWSARPPEIPEGMVGVAATRGGSRSPDAELEYFLVPEEEYARRSGRGFVIDLNRHKKTSRIR